LPESYLLLFFPPTFFPLFVVFKPFEIVRKMAVTIYREIRTDSIEFDSVNFPIGEIQRKQTGAMIDHLSFSAQV
jgi:hypothetical protein